MLIYETLKKDHDKVKMLLDELLNLSEDDENREKLVQHIHDELIPHARAEEAVFYNSIRSMDEEKDKIMHAYKEHAEAETLLKTLQAKGKSDTDWKETARELKSAVLHHINEEEGPTFQLARQLFSTEEAEQLGEAFEKMKPEVKEEGVVESTMDLIANLMPPRFMNAIRGDKSELTKNA